MRRKIIAATEPYDFLSGGGGFQSLKEFPCDPLVSEIFGYTELDYAKTVWVGIIQEVASELTILGRGPQHPFFFEMIFQSNSGKETHRPTVPFH